MGYNAILVLKNSEIDLIRDDKGFGKKVASLIRGADTVNHFDKTSNHPDAMVSSSRMRNVLGHRYENDEDDDYPYELQTAQPHHASEVKVFFIEQGELHVIPFYGDHMAVETWDAFAVKARELGIESKRGKSFDTRKLGEVDIIQDEELTNDWSQEKFNESTTSLCVLIDVLHEVERDEKLGKTVADKIEKIWKAKAELNEKLKKDPELSASIPSYSLSVRSGVSVIDITPSARSEIIALGGNWGRVIKSELENSSKDPNYPRKDLVDRDVDVVANSLQMVGYSIKLPHNKRMVSPPSYWNKDRFIVENDEEDLSPQL